MQIEYHYKQLKKGHLKELVSEIFIVVLMVNGRESHEKNLMS